jgi:hypothetical protein
MLFVANDNGEVIGVIRKSDVMDKVLLSHNLGEKNGINEISNALISVLEHREKHHQSSSKTEVVKRTKRIVSH